MALAASLAAGAVLKLMSADFPQKAQELFEALQAIVQHLHPGASLTRMDRWDGPWPKVAAALRK